MSALIQRLCLQLTVGGQATPTPGKSHMAHKRHIDFFRWSHATESKRITSAADSLNETFLKRMHKVEAKYSSLLPLIQNKWDIWWEYARVTVTSMPLLGAT